MTQKKKVINLFGFLMDLIEEPTTEVESQIKPQHQENKVLDTDDFTNSGELLEPPKTVFDNTVANPIERLGLNPLNLNPKKKNPPLIDVDKIKEMMDKVDAIHKDNAYDTRVLRRVNDATRPLKAYIEEMKGKAHAEAFVARSEEEMENSGEEERIGMTLVNSKLTAVKVPAELRDNLPLSHNNDGPIAVKVKEGEIEKITGFEELPPEIQKLLKQDVIQTDDECPNYEGPNYRGPGIEPTNN